MAKKMQDKLNKLLKNSYNKYSHVAVAAIVTDNHGKEYGGVNIENAAYPSSICAERNAIFHAVSNGVQPSDIQQIDLTSNIKGFLYPCGGCRQVMTEWMPIEGIVNVWYNNQKHTQTLKELLPMPITKESFKWK